VALGEGGARGKLGGECVSGAEAIAGEELSKEYSFAHLSEWRLRNLFKILLSQTEQIVVSPDQ
jgi:hypothetical protein